MNQYRFYQTRHGELIMSGRNAYLMLEPDAGKLDRRIAVQQSRTFAAIAIRAERNRCHA